MEGAVEQNSFSGSKIKGEVERILVNSINYTFVNGAEVGIPAGIDGKTTYPLIEFHMVDLKRDDIVLNCLPPLVGFGPAATMVSVDPFIYVFGGLKQSMVESDDFKKLQCQPSKSDKQIFLGGSCIDLDMYNSLGHLWDPAPIPIKNRCYTRCTSLLGKIYTFGPLCLAPEVFDPTVGHWKLIPLPSELDGCKLSTAPIPDPSNHRILLLLYGGKLSSPALYAFSDKAWECIEPDFRCSTHAVAVSDDVLYFNAHGFPSVIIAFDLPSRTWLEVRWSSSHFESGVGMNYTTKRFKALFPFGDNILCLATWSRLSPFADYPHGKTEISFFKFRVEHRDGAVNLTPVSFNSYDIPSTCLVLNFLPF